jgi:putative oxidoreductase
MKKISLLNGLGRALAAGIFVSAGIQKLRDVDSTVGYMKSKGMPESRGLAYAAAAVEAGIGPLFALGVRPHLSALALASFLVPTTVIFHDFWRTEGQDKQMQTINFFKNLAIIGGLLGFAASEFEKRGTLSRRSEKSTLIGGREGYLDFNGDITEESVRKLRAS